MPQSHTRSGGRIVLGLIVLGVMALTLVKLGGYLLSSPQLLHQSDFTYVGAFKVPVGQVGPQANGFFDYSNGQGSGRVYNDPVNGKSLFLSGYLSTGYVSNAVSVAQVKIPTLQDPNVVGLSGLNTATVVQGSAD